MSGTRLRRPSIVVALTMFAVTVGLTFLTWEVNDNSEDSLLRRQLGQVGTLLTSQATVLQVQLADIGVVALATEADPEAFARFADRQLQQTGQSLSLWRQLSAAYDDAFQAALRGLELDASART